MEGKMVGSASQLTSPGALKTERLVAMALNGEILEVDPCEFRRFDVVSNDSDHHFLKPNEKNADCFSNAASGVHAKIMQEWRILEKNLPDSIFVRVYERRIDLLRAVIVGAAGTPYHDGLFVFDIAFPRDYPVYPPQVHYRSFGLRLNPNLYADGQVCLSLLNTWAGKKKEKWDPSQSTVLQVLISLQALVLNEKPYYNEPGHEPSRFGWEKNSMAYSETVFALSCKSMLHLLRNPPINFEALIKAHFRDRARVILEACNAYTHGRVKVGYYRGDDGDSSSSSSSSKIHVSRTFKSSMRMLLPDLVYSFTKNGASVGNFIEQLEQDRKKASSQLQPAAHDKQGIAIKAITSIFKKIMGLKKRRRKGNGVAANNGTEIQG